MKQWIQLLSSVSLALSITSSAPAGEPSLATVEQQFRELPMEAKRLTGPLFWLHGDESKERLEMYLDKVAESGNGCFTAESRPHQDWLGEGWYRDLDICLQAAKKHDLKMWIFDEKWWPSQGVGGKVPARYAAKRLAAEARRRSKARLHSRPRVIPVSATSPRWRASSMPTARSMGDSIVDLQDFITDGKLSWQAPAGKWQVMKFTHTQAPGLGQNGTAQRRWGQPRLHRVVHPDRLSAALRPLRQGLRQDHSRLLLRRAGDPGRLGHGAERHPEGVERRLEESLCRLQVRPRRRGRRRRALPVPGCLCRNLGPRDVRRHGRLVPPTQGAIHGPFHGARLSVRQSATSAPAT